jgi:hypothetical protein
MGRSVLFQRHADQAPAANALARAFPGNLRQPRVRRGVHQRPQCHCIDPNNFVLNPGGPNGGWLSRDARLILPSTATVQEACSRRTFGSAKDIQRPRQFVNRIIR